MVLPECYMEIANPWGMTGSVLPLTCNMCFLTFIYVGQQFAEATSDMLCHIGFPHASPSVANQQTSGGSCYKLQRNRERLISAEVSGRLLFRDVANVWQLLGFIGTFGKHHPANMPVCHSLGRAMNLKG